MNKNIDAFSILKSINDSDIYNVINQITCACFQEQDIYIGTKTGIIHKLEHQRLNDEDELGFVTSLLISLEIIKNYSIDQLEICRWLNLVVALTNETLIFVAESPFNIQPMNCRLKGVTSMCIKEGVTVNEEFVTEMCVGLASKRLQLYLVSLDRITLLKEISISSVPLVLCLDHNIICMASSSAYSIVNISTELVTELFSFQLSKMRPKIAQLPNKAGMLLLGPDGLGIFADSEGASQRPPIQWGSTIRDFVALRSHLVAIDNEFVMIHSITNQEQIQTVHYPNQNSFLVGSNTNVLIFSNHHLPKWNIEQLTPLSWNQQANQYITKGLVDKAVSIAQNQSSKPNLSSLSKQRIAKLFVLAGFQKFKCAQFKEAKILFEKGSVDLREIINCYQDLLPKSYKFEPKIATVDSGFHISSIFSGEDRQLKTELEYKQFLLDLLVEHRDSNLARAFSQIVETALVKLYVELEPQKLFHNFTMMLTDVDYDDLVDYLTNIGHFHACAMVMQWYGQLDKAVNIWSRLVREEIVDPLFPGIEFLKEVLSNISDPNIIVKNIDWLLKLDPCSTSEILRNFIDRFKNEHDLINILITDEVMSHIQCYPDTLFDILYELCLNGLMQNHSQHEHLAKIFMKKLFETKSDPQSFNAIRFPFWLLQLNKLSIFRSKFQQFLIVSDDYPTQKLLIEIKEFPVKLLIEEAWILGQMAEHESALKIIVFQLQDFKFAENYCLLFEKKSKNSQSNLFLKLLGVYLSNEDTSHQDEYKNAALNLLEAQACKFNMKEVLTLLPNDWPLNRLRQFLLNSSAIRNQTCFTIKMKCSLEKVRTHRKLCEVRGILQSNKLIIEDWQQLLCSQCGDNIENCSFIKTQNGQLLHKHCFNCS